MASSTAELGTMDRESSLPKWAVHLEFASGDRKQAESALLHLYRAAGLEPPTRIVWFTNPSQGLLAHACLQHLHGESLFRGDEPAIFRALMTLYRKWQKTASDYFPNPPWNHFETGRRLNFRHQAVREPMIKQALALMAGETPSSEDLEAVRTALAPNMSFEQLLRALPRAFKSLGVHPGWSSPGYVRTFNFEIQTSSGKKFTLRSPRCMNFDQVASTVYKVDKLSRGWPSWWAPLRDLTRMGGWLWPFDPVTVMTDRPDYSEYDSEDRLHSGKGPALRFADGQSVFFWEGEVVAENAIRSPQDVGPEQVLGVMELEKKRALLARIGEAVIDDAAWPPELQKLARMVFRRQYKRYTADDVSDWARLGKEGTSLPKGCYYTLHPSGQLQTVFRVPPSGPKLILSLAEGKAEGKMVQGSFAEKYYEDGRMEDFSPYDDTSPPYLTELSFSEWVEKGFVQIRGVRRQARPIVVSPSREQTDKTPESFLSVLLRLSQGPPVDTRWNLFNSLTEANLSDELIHLLGTFGVAACQRVLCPSEHHRAEVFLRPDWSAPHRPVEEVPLESVEVYRQVKALAGDEVEKARSLNKTPYMVEWLARPSPVSVKKRGGLPVPVEWLPPGSELDRFWMTEVAAQILLRQEASRGADLEHYLSQVDREKFFAKAGFVTAFVHSAYGSGAALPGPKHPYFKERDCELKELLGTVSESPHLPHHIGCHGSDGPFLTSLALWVHYQATGSAPTEQQVAVVRWLLPFFNRRFGTFPSTLRELAKGREYWELSYPVQEWPEPFKDKVRLDPSSNLPRIFEKLAKQFLQATPLAALWSNSDSLRFSQRVVSAGRFLASGQLEGGDTSGLANLASMEGLPRVFRYAEWVFEPWPKSDPNLTTLLGHWMMVGL